MELKDTVTLMTDESYKARFIAEYRQTKIRYEKLKAFNNKIEAFNRVRFAEVSNKLDEPKHDCPYDLLLEQQHIMGEYLHILEVRAVIENVDLNQE